MVAENLVDSLLYFEHNISLSDNPSYNTTFKIDGVTVRMYCEYNTRKKQRLISIHDLSGNILLKQTFIVFGRRCELNFNAENLDLRYYVTLKPTGNRLNFNDYDYKSWSSDFTLCLIGGSQEQHEYLKTNLRKVLTGN